MPDLSHAAALADRVAMGDAASVGMSRRQLKTRGYMETINQPETGAVIVEDCALCGDHSGERSGSGGVEWATCRPCRVTVAALFAGATIAIGDRTFATAPDGAIYEREERGGVVSYYALTRVCVAIDHETEKYVYCDPCGLEFGGLTRHPAPVCQPGAPRYRKQ